MIKLGAMWISKNPKVAFSGQLDFNNIPHQLTIPIIIFKNRKQKDNQPDYIIYLSEPRESKPKKDEEIVPF